VVTGSLNPLPTAAATSSPGSERPEWLALRHTQVASAQRVDLLRRSRIPNPSISFFAQNDGFDEQVLGVGLSIPVPLPQPVGRTSAGEIAEASALSHKAELEAEHTRRELASELTVATAQYETSVKIRGLYTPEHAQRALMRLDAIGVQLKATRLSVRDAIVMQQALVELLKAEIDAREALCLASVRLTRAVGLSLEGDSL
jgi:cobalt-zinc-cadmium efflux system outer membrane protein